MSTVSATRTVYEAVGAELRASFNAELAGACTDLGIEVFGFNWALADGEPNNCYEGNRQFDELIALEEPDFPAVAWWVGAGRDENRQKARRFSGTVEIGVRAWLFSPGKYERTLGMKMRMAFESSLIAVLLAVGDNPGYRKDLNWGTLVDLRWIDPDEQDRGWVQQVDFGASFEVNV